MTEALQKMVEAMAVEIDRQVVDLGGRPVGLTLPLVYSHQPIDLEKVARAGLEALDDLPDEIGLALTRLPGDYRPGSHSAHDIWRAKLAEILKDAP